MSGFMINLLNQRKIVDEYINRNEKIIENNYYKIINQKYKKIIILYDFNEYKIYYLAYYI